MVDEEGNIMVYVDPDDVNYIAVKSSLSTDLISGITFDISHRVDPEMWKYLSFVKENTIFKKMVKIDNKKPRKKAVKNKAI
jgi:hypothetical protein